MYQLSIQNDAGEQVKSESFEIQYDAKVGFKRSVMAFSRKSGRFEIVLESPEGKKLYSQKAGLDW
ncbi:hypothetical protein [Pseudalkalibacillus caeni]|uniref:Uncharacterized protein n=1 Tax=Exobacillus caeni TaxID=2574798 RepID=A0A5R9FH27_9BACL|nr:hypothetical protein [Pseudalkalibacillus caeni]TLS38855.1 hypothetical protein FCL54_00630 [Pseudalkalibacillus caeni]